MVGEMNSVTHKNNTIVRKGIFKGSGVCSCHEGGACQCFHNSLSRSPNPKVKSTASSDKNSTLLGKSIKVAGDPGHAETGDRCGVTCKALIVTTFVVFCVIIASSSLYCRRRKRWKNAVEGPSHTTVQEARDMVHGSRPPVDPTWEVDRSRITVQGVLGEGEFGQVLLGRLASERSNTRGSRSAPRLVALKTVKEGAGSSELKDLLSEFALLKDTSHPNVIRLIGACTTGNGPVYLILEYAALGSLRGYLVKCRHAVNGEDEVRATDKQQPVMTHTRMLSFAWQIAKGMEYLSQIKLVHRDLACRNILLTEDLRCKISDFGLTRDVYEDATYIKSSVGKVPVRWMSPESMWKRVYSSKSDVWSFGVVVWEIATLGAVPYTGVPAELLPASVRDGLRLPKPEFCGDQLHNLMMCCWASDPDDRPEFSEIAAKLDDIASRRSGYMMLDGRAVTNPSYFQMSNEQSHAISQSEEEDYGKQKAVVYENGLVELSLFSRTAAVPHQEIVTPQITAL